MAINLFGGEAALTIDDESVDADAEQLDIPIHAFDLIVADECHRGYSAKELSIWRDTLDHFDAIKIGLTATPAAHTMAYFENLVYRYDYERAVREGYLVDYDVVRVRSDVRMNGVFLHEGEQVDQVDPETGAKQLDLLEDERAFDAADVEREITAPDSNRNDPRRAQALRRRARGRARPLPEDADLRRQRPAAHLPRRPARRAGARRSSAAATPSSPRSPAGSTGRCSGSASSATGPSPASSSPSTCSPPASTSRTWSSSSSCAR